MQGHFYESGSCVPKSCAILGVHPTIPGITCVHVAPLSVERKIPPPLNVKFVIAASTTLPFPGWTAIAPTLVPNAFPIKGHVAPGVEHARLHELPPSMDFKIPAPEYESMLKSSSPVPA